MDNQPWGMPQEEYKALNPRDKKQVRNRLVSRAPHTDFLCGFTSSADIAFIGSEHVASERNVKVDFDFNLNNLRHRSQLLQELTQCCRLRCNP